MPIDYERMKRVYPKQKSALTRAKKTGRYSAVLAACKAAVEEWNQIGAWPDAWSHWQNALIDAGNKRTRETGVYINVPRLEDL